MKCKLHLFRLFLEGGGVGTTKNQHRIICEAASFPTIIGGSADPNPNSRSYIISALHGVSDPITNHAAQTILSVLCTFSTVRGYNINGIIMGFHDNRSDSQFGTIIQLQRNNNINGSGSYSRLSLFANTISMTSLRHYGNDIQYLKKNGISCDITNA